MNNIFRIARTELRTLFYSPIAWFILVAFLVQTALIYFGIMEKFVSMKEMGGESARSLKDYHLTIQIFGPGEMGISSEIMRKLYFYIPLITMSLLAKETDSGTIKLLYSSPVRMWEIVGGKFMTMLFFSLVMTGIIAVFMVIAGFNIKNADTGILLSAALGFFLVFCTYSAVGLFMSSLTSYQVVAAIITFATIALLTYVGSLWQQVDFIRDLTYCLSIGGRAENLLSGLITTRDALYFIIVTCIFLAFTYLKLNSNFEVKRFVVSLCQYSLVIVLALVIGYLSSRPKLTAYWDVSADQRNTLSPEVQSLLGKMDAPLEIITYNNIMSDFTANGLPENRNSTMELWSKYLRFKPSMKFSFIQFYDMLLDKDPNMSFSNLYPGKTLEQAAKQIIYAKEMDSSDFKTPEEIRKIIDLKPELNRYVMQLKYKGKSTFLRVFDDNPGWPSEAEVGAALKRLLAKKIPKVYFVTGNLERNIDLPGKREYGKLAHDISYRYSLINQGFDTDTLSLDHQYISRDASTIVIADPRTALSSNTTIKLWKYIRDGGNLLIAAEPGKQSVLNPILEQIGIQLTAGTVVQATTSYDPDFLLLKPTLYSLSYTDNFFKSYFQDGWPIVMSGSTGIAYSGSAGFKTNILLAHEGGSSQKRNVLGKQDSGQTFNPAPGDVKGNFPTAVALTRKVGGKEQRIVVTGDADFMSNGYLRIPEIQVANLAFRTSVFSWLNQANSPICTITSDPKDNEILLSSNGFKILSILMQWNVPGLITVLGAVILIRRKRK